MPNSRNQLIFAVVRILIGALFIYAGFVKGLNPPGLARDIRTYRILPEILVVFSSYCLPLVEFLCGLSLVVKRWHRLGLCVLAFLMFVFTLALGSAWLRGLKLSCGCFGTQSSPATYADYIGYLTRDLILLTVLIGLTVYEFRQSAVSNRQ